MQWLQVNLVTCNAGRHALNMQVRPGGHANYESTFITLGTMINYNKDSATTAYSACEGLAIILPLALLGCPGFEFGHMLPGSTSLCWLMLAGKFSMVHKEASSAAAAAKVNGALQKHCSQLKPCAAGTLPRVTDMHTNIVQGS